MRIGLQPVGLTLQIRMYIKQQQVNCMCNNGRDSRCRCRAWSVQSHSPGSAYMYTHLMPGPTLVASPNSISIGSITEVQVGLTGYRTTGYSSSQQASPLRELTCHMGSHSVTSIKAGTRFSDPRGTQGWVDPVGLVTYRGGIPGRRRSPIPVLTGLNVEPLRSCDERRYDNAKPPTNIRTHRTRI